MSSYSRPARDSRTGHRLASTLTGRAPRQTRSLPWWYWPFELVGRIETRLLARHPIEFWEK
jgi:hypothetical protein